MSHSVENIDLSDSQVEGASLKPGNYTCICTSMEVKDTSTGNGKQVILTWQDEAGGGQVKDFINLFHSKAETRDIAKRRFKSALFYGGHPNSDRPGGIADIRRWMETNGWRCGVRVEQGDDWVNDKGETVKGGGKIKKSGAYYAATAPAPRPGGGGGGGDLDDEIPF